MPRLALTRRSLLAAPLLMRANARDIRVITVRTKEEHHRYRTPYMFGGHQVSQVTLLNVYVEVENRSGQRAAGFGSMPLGNVWSFPSAKLSYDQTLGAMRTLAGKIRDFIADRPDYGHPIELNHQFEPEYLKLAAGINVGEPVPKLCTLVTASPFDAALHDAYGKLYRRSAYLTYSREFLNEDLSRYLNSGFKGRYLDSFIQPRPAPRIAVFHSVGASDPITSADASHPIGDKLPESLPEWLVYNGIWHIKIKLNGDDPAGDRERILAVHAAATTVRACRYSLDFNERCPNAGALIGILRQLRERTPSCFERILYVEQPTRRDLRADRGNDMHEAAKLRPVVIDESLTDLDALLLAREMGYTGVALKACKGQSQALLMAAAAQHYGMFRTVQDLTCPGASLIQSAGLAAHVPGVAGIEANARQYVPSANAAWVASFPGIFRIEDGTMQTSTLTGPGLGAV